MLTLYLVWVVFVNGLRKLLHHDYRNHRGRGHDHDSLRALYLAMQRRRRRMVHWHRLYGRVCLCGAAARV